MRLNLLKLSYLSSLDYKVSLLLKAKKRQIGPKVNINSANDFI